jgi:O-antigen/teichoic acid export membrane protein
MPAFISARLPRESSLQAVALAARQIFVQALGIVTGVVLARTVSVDTFGMYAVLSFQFMLQLSIGDLGIGASVIRQEQAPTFEQLRAVQGVRVLVDCLQLGILYVSAPWLAALYGGGEEVAAAFRIVAAAVCIQSLQVVPTVLLERSVRFGTLAIIESVQAVVYAMLCIAAAWSTMPIRGVAVAWLGYALVGSLLSLRCSPWSMGVAFDHSLYRERVGFSLRYQGGQLAVVLRDSFTPVVLGMLIGATAVGQVSWATTCALSIGMGAFVLQRFFMPFFSQGEQDVAARQCSLEHAIRITHVLVVPASALVLSLAPAITKVVFGEQWLAALPLFYVLWIVNFFIPFVPPLIGYLYAMGRSDITLRFTLMVTGLTWALGIPLVLLCGTLGFPIAMIGGFATTLLLIRRVQALQPFQCLPVVLPIWGTASLVGIAEVFLQRVYPVESFVQLILYGAAGGLLWLVLYAASTGSVLSRRQIAAVWSPGD